MARTIETEAVAGVLRRLYARSVPEDAAARDRVAMAEARDGRRLSTGARYEIYGDAPLAIAPETGELIYALTVGLRPRSIVEFGASYGASTIYLASGLRDVGEGGSVVSTEISARKAAAALENISEAGLGDLVSILVGDARETLDDISAPVEMLVLDGRNDLYLDVLCLLEGKLAPGALVVADLSRDDPDLTRFRNHVRSSDGNYRSVRLPIDSGIEISLWRDA